MAASPYATRLAAELQKFPMLDPRAVEGVASQEGLGGGIGDNGTSFGPFQLHIGGAYPSFAPHDTQAAQSWSWSPEGIDYALQQIAKVAGGMKGTRAINAIVSQFERPANIPREIAGASRSYGVAMPVGPASTSAPLPMPTPGASTPGTAAALPLTPLHAAGLNAIVSYLMGKS